MTRKKKMRSKVDPITGNPSTADNAISIGAFRLRRRVDPLTGKPTDSDDAISYCAFKKRESKKRKRNKAQLVQGVQRHRFSLQIYKGAGNKNMDAGGIIKAEVSDHKLGF